MINLSPCTNSITIAPVALRPETQWKENEIPGEDPKPGWVGGARNLNRTLNKQSAVQHTHNVGTCNGTGSCKSDS